MDDRFIPDVSREQYEFIRTARGADFPDTYDEWLELVVEQRKDRVQRSIRWESIKINPHEFAERCRARGVNPTMKALYEVAFEKGLGHI